MGASACQCLFKEQQLFRVNQRARRLVGRCTHQKSLNMRPESSRLHYCEQISHCYYFFLVTIKITLQPTQLCAIYRDQIIIKTFMLQASAMTFFSPSFSSQLSNNIVITSFFVSHSPWCYRRAYFHCLRPQKVSHKEQTFLCTVNTFMLSFQVSKYIYFMSH